MSGRRNQITRNNRSRHSISGSGNENGKSSNSGGVQLHQQPTPQQTTQANDALAAIAQYLEAQEARHEARFSLLTQSLAQISTRLTTIEREQSDLAKSQQILSFRAGTDRRIHAITKRLESIESTIYAAKTTLETDVIDMITQSHEAVKSEIVASAGQVISAVVPGLVHFQKSAFMLERKVDDCCVTAEYIAEGQDEMCAKMDAVVRAFEEESLEDDGEEASGGHLVEEEQALDEEEVMYFDAV